MPDKSFNKPKKIEYESPKQEPFDPKSQEETPLQTEFKEKDEVQSTASIVVEEYARTIEFMKFLEKLLRDISKVEVEINPEDDPEVWIAMNRVFSNPAPKLNQDSYFQVVDALEVIERIEQVEDDPRTGIEDNFLDNLPHFQEVEESEGEITDQDFQISAVDEIEEKSIVKRASAFRDPPPPPPPPKPLIERTWLRRWRKFNRKVNVLGKSYKVQWLQNRWWKDRNRRK